MEDDDELHRLLVELKMAQRHEGNSELDRRRRSFNEKDGNRCIFTPEAPLMPYWNGLLALLVCLSGIAVPLQLAFEEQFADAGSAWEVRCLCTLSTRASSPWP